MQIYRSAFDGANRVSSVDYRVSPAWNGTFRDVRTYSYTYNAWGEILSATGDMADINPLRYRGYYFDSDTGLYYLKSRYYDPQLCRFINSDEYASTGQGVTGTNMFAYCKNNPILYADNTGEFAGIVVGAITGAVFGAINAGISGDNIIVGALLGAGSGVILGAVSSFAFAAAATVKIAQTASTVVKVAVKTAPVIATAVAAASLDIGGQYVQHEKKVSSGETTENFKVNTASAITAGVFAGIGASLGNALSPSNFANTAEKFLTETVVNWFSNLTAGVSETFARILSIRR